MKLSPSAKVGGAMLAVFILAGVFGPLVAPYDMSVMHDATKEAFQGPSAAHWLGTDSNGRDTLSQLLWGARKALVLSVIVVAISSTIGLSVGVVAGWYRGWVDNVLMRLVDLILTVPGLVVLIVVASNFPNLRSATGIALILGLFGWLDLSRILRSQILGLREREFIEAAHALGASDIRIMFKHLVPNMLGSIIVWATLAAATIVLAEATLTYFGFGVANDTSLGKLVSDGVSAASTRPWLFYYPGIMLLIIALCINLIGDGIRDAFDPSNKKVRA